jgi:hypothetical protein
MTTARVLSALLAAVIIGALVVLIVPGGGGAAASADGIAGIVIPAALTEPLHDEDGAAAPMLAPAARPVRVALATPGALVAGRGSAAMPTAWSGSGYGIGDIWGQAGAVSRTSDAFVSYASSCVFRRITVAGAAACGGADPGPISFVRFQVPYDAVGTYDAGSRSCVYSAALQAGGAGFQGRERPSEDWNYLYARLRAARRDGLTPMVDIVYGTTIAAPGVDGAGNGVPLTPIVDGANPDGTTPRDAWLDYACGVELLMWATDAAGVPVSYWEAWNEPNVACVAWHGLGPCPSGQLAYDRPSGTGAGTGSWNAAYLWYTANAEGSYVARAERVPEYVSALTASANDEPYDAAYVENVRGISHCLTTGGTASSSYLPPWGCNATELGWPRWTPVYWSVHDYDDPSWGDALPHDRRAGDDLSTFERWLASVPGLDDRSGLRVWVSEAAVQLDDGATGDQNGAAGRCDDLRLAGAGDQGTTGTIGACNDGNPGSQYRGAAIWASLGRLGATAQHRVSTTIVIWYEFALGTSRRQDRWDSAMTVSAGGNHYRPRAAYCALSDLPLSDCSTLPTNASWNYLDPATGIKSRQASK